MLSLSSLLAYIILLERSHHASVMSNKHKMIIACNVQRRQQDQFYA